VAEPCDDGRVSEPKAVAESTTEVVPGLRSWQVEDERIGGFVSTAYAIEGPDGAVLVDPLPLAPAALTAIGPVSAIVLSSGSHQRSAWRLRRELGAPVWAPALSREIEEDPDERYCEGDDLPGGLTAVFTPGAGTTQHTLLSPGTPRVAIVPDLLIRAPGEEPTLIPDAYAHDPAVARKSARRLLELDLDVLCLCHGGAVADDPKGAVRRALGEV
jgi:hypothetical protein